MTQDTELAVLHRVVGEGKDALAMLERRARRLRALNRADVLVPLDVVLEDGVVKARLPVVHGRDLADLEAHREPLGAGECAYLGVAVARALEAMHDAGLVHGDLSPSNVVVTDAGVTLVDTLTGAHEHERGTRGFRAPERVEGATEAADVYSLGSLLRWAVRERDRTIVEAWTTPLTAPDPRLRPTAGAVAVALEKCASPVPLAMPGRDVASALRASAATRTERTPAGRWWRARRYAVRGALTAAVVGAVATTAVAIPRPSDAVAGELAGTYAHVTPTRTSTVTPSDKPIPAPAHQEVRDEAVAAASDLTAQRMDALRMGDADLLAATVVGQHESVRAVRAQADSLANQSVRYLDLGCTVTALTYLGVKDKVHRVAVAYTVSDHEVVTPTSAVVVPSYQEEVVLSVTKRDGHWKVTRVQPRT